MTTIIAASVISGALAYVIGCTLGRTFAAPFALIAAMAIPVIAFS